MKPDTETLESMPFLSRDGDPLEKEFKSLQSRVRSLARLSSKTTHTLVFLLASALWAAVFFFFSLAGKQTPIKPSDLGVGKSIFAGSKVIGCGTSLEEAERRGCEYDILANAFFPKVCIEEQGLDEYKQEGTTWYGYADSNHTERLPSDQEMGRRGLYYTNKRDHIVHCALLWKRQYRAFAENRRFIDSVIASEEHTYHCVQYLMDVTDELDHPDWRTVPISVVVGYAGCFDVAP